MIITNSRNALVGYFIISYPTRAHGIIVIWFVERPSIFSSVCKSLSEKKGKNTQKTETAAGRLHLGSYTKARKIFSNARNAAKLRAGKKYTEIHSPSGPVNFSFHLPPLQYYLPMWRPVWQPEEKHEQSVLGFLTNPCFQLSS